MEKAYQIIKEAMKELIDRLFFTIKLLSSKMKATEIKKNKEIIIGKIFASSKL